MPRVKRGFTRHRRHAKVLGMVKGHMLSRGHLYRTAHQEMMRSLMYAYRDRRARKRDMRSLWIVRINAASRQNGLPYNRFIAGVNTLGLQINRKMLAEMAVNDPHAFATLVARVKGEPPPAPPQAAPVVPAVAAEAAPAAAPAASAPAAAESTVFTPQAEAPAEQETVDEQEAEAAGEPLDHAGTADPVDRPRDDQQQGESR